MATDTNRLLEASLATLRAVRDLVAIRAGAPIALLALDQALVFIGYQVDVDDETLAEDALDRARAIGVCAECGTACEEDGANERCFHPTGCGALNGLLPASAEALRASIRRTRAEAARLKLDRLPQDRRCNDLCPGWCVSEVNRAAAFAIERCEDCWAGTPEDEILHDDEALALPEALIALAHSLLLDSL